MNAEPNPEKEVMPDYEQCQKLWVAVVHRAFSDLKRAAATANNPRGKHRREARKGAIGMVNGCLRFFYDDSHRVKGNIPTLEIMDHAGGSNTIRKGVLSCFKNSKGECQQLIVAAIEDGSLNISDRRLSPLS